MQITAAGVDSSILDLPWDTALAEWPETVLAVLPRGLSRHEVRFVRLSGQIIAVKEIGDWVAEREYNLLKRLANESVPSVEPVGFITGRVDRDGEPLAGALLTRHLRYSLPYRTLFTRDLRSDTAELLIDALVALLVRLHLIGFYWGDVSLSNTLFLRDAEAYEAYLVDAETSEMHPALTTGQREYDLEIARVNIIGELMDLAEAGEMKNSPSDMDSLVRVGDRLVERYESLWAAVTELETIDITERWRISDRIRRLGDMGFDVAEMELATTADGRSLQVRPRVVSGKYYSTRLEHLTGMEVGEKQARRLLVHMDQWAARTGRADEPEDFIAREWLTEAFEATIRQVPINLRYRLSPAQLFHEILDHRWLLATEQQRNLPISEAVDSYVHNVLEFKPDERLQLDNPTQSIPPVGAADH